MIDRFTQKAREAIRLAVETAQELEHGYVGTEHLLLGLIKEGTGVAAAVLAEHDVTEERVMELMERLIRLNIRRGRAPCCRRVMMRRFFSKRL